MKKQEVIKNLIRLADHLDVRKLGDEADFVDSVIKKVSEEKDYDTEISSLKLRLERLTRLLDEHNIIPEDKDSDESVNYNKDMEHN